MGKLNNYLLIIDDDRDRADLITARLKPLFNMVHIVGNFKDAVEEVKNVPYEFILLDIHLPDGNGMDKVGQIKDLSPDSEIILMTAYKRRSAVELMKDNIIWMIIDTTDEMQSLPDLIEMKRGFKEVKELIHA